MLCKPSLLGHHHNSPQNKSTIAQTMAPSVQITDVSDLMKHHLVDIFKTMLSMPAVPAQPGEQAADEERVAGSVGFAGESVTGAVYLHVSTPFANRMAAIMLGLSPEQTINDNDVNDVVGEICNMLTGGLKSWLCDAGAECALSTPAIIRGRSFAIESIGDVQREYLTFACGQDHVVVEIHIKLD
jgi:CheY-specific phosphatase CheX